jgi:hypothetical protein
VKQFDLESLSPPLLVVVTHVGSVPLAVWSTVRARVPFAAMAAVCGRS